MPSKDPFSKARPGRGKRFEVPSTDPLRSIRPRKSGGRIEAKDYTKFIKWTPLKVSIATLLIFTPYAALVYAVASATSIMAVVPMLIAPALIAVFAGIIYWLSKAML